MLKVLLPLSILIAVLAFAQADGTQPTATTLPAGRYISSGFLSYGSIDMAPDGRAESNGSTCFGHSHAMGHASWQAEPELIRIVWDCDPAAPTTRPAACFDIVRWGERVYLVELLPNFINEINAGDEPRTTNEGMAYLRDGDWERPANGSPVLPAKFARSIFLEPLRGVIRSKDHRSGMINLGTADGVFVGMHFYSREAGSHWKVEVVSVQETKSVVKPALGFAFIPVAAHVSSRRKDPLRPN